MQRNKDVSFRTTKPARSGFCHYAGRTGFEYYQQYHRNFIAIKMTNQIIP